MSYSGFGNLRKLILLVLELRHAFPPKGGMGMSPGDSMVCSCMLKRKKQRKYKYLLLHFGSACT